MIAVVAATGLGAAAPSLLDIVQINPIYSVPAGAFSMATTTKLIGTAAVQFYGGESAAPGVASDRVLA
jgi:hypothetical protein